MEEDIQNHSTTVMFRGTPCSSKVQRFAFFPSTFMPYSVYFMTEKKEWFFKQGRRREATKLHNFIFMIYLQTLFSSERNSTHWILMLTNEGFQAGVCSPVYF